MRGGLRRWLACVMMGLAILLGLAACSSSTAKSIPAPTATPGDITLVPDRVVYTPTEPVGITLKNNASKAYYAFDGRTACTFLDFQEYVPAKKAWAFVNPCTTGQPPQAFLIPAGASEPFTLAPGNAPTNPNQWQDGTYRVALTYNTQQDGKGTSQIVYSPGFVVQG